MMRKRMHIKTFFLFITILCSQNIILFGQVSAQISIPFEIYDDAGGQKTLYFGLDQTATDGIDVHLGESDLPPYPPIGAFDARWLLPENGFSGSLSSWSDYRYVAGFPFSGTIEHRFRYQSAGGATAMFVSWNLPQAVTGLLQDLSNGNIINYPISGTGTFQINDFDSIDKLKLFIYYNNIVSEVENDIELPDEFILVQNYPNPFNPNTMIEWQTPVGSWQILKVYDALGNEIVTLVDEYKAAGKYEVEFDASTLSSGVYYYQLRTGSFFQSKKMILAK